MIPKLVFLLMCVLLSASSVAVAQNEAVEATLYQTVNVRGGPNTRYEIVARVSAGDTVRVIGRGDELGSWLQVELADGTLGWVPRYLLIIDGDIERLPLVSFGVDDPDQSEVFVTAYGTVNVRRGPSITDSIVAQLDTGEQARALARNSESSDWLYVENLALAGWVAYFTVDVQGDPRALPVRVPDIVTDGLIPPSELITALFNTRLHTEPELDSEVVEVLPFGTVALPFARVEDATWIYVGTADLRGWGAAELFSISPEQLEALPTYSDDAIYELTPELESVLQQNNATVEVTPFVILVTDEPTSEPTAEVTPNG